MTIFDMEPKDLTDDELKTVWEEWARLDAQGDLSYDGLASMAAVEMEIGKRQNIDKFL